MRSQPYGTWESPITAELVASGARRLGSVTVDGDAIYWVEARPDEAGRNVLLRWDPGRGVREITSAPINVRTRVHEYGGLAYVATRGTICYAEFSDQRVYRLAPGDVPHPLTVAGDRSYADFIFDAVRNRIICVREDRTTAGKEPTNSLVAIPLDGSQAVAELQGGFDFYAFPRLNADGSQLAWICWRHPQMPWDGTELWLGDVTPAGMIANERRVAGARDEAIFQPGWSPDGTLHFVSDRDGWWNLYRVRGSTVECVYAAAVDFGRPLWQLGMSTWAFSDTSRIVVAYQQQGIWRLGMVDSRTGAFTPIALDLEPGENIAATPTHAMFVAGSSTEPDALVRIELAGFRVERLRVAAERSVGRTYISVPEAIAIPTESGLTTHAFFYPPRNPEYSPPAGSRPPLIVISHGGPTASTSTRLSLEIQYWTSRGFAVADVNYGGSSGYGRDYRRRLNGQWGVVDVDDCVSAARWFAAQGLVDDQQFIIRGRSAGGYTTLATLTFRPGVFAAGASYYGVSDLEAMLRDTHKFESRYLEGLVGPYPGAADVYRARSPIRFVERLACPIIFFQGLDDRVVPPSQSHTMAEAIRAKGFRAPLLAFEGEQHGFRRAETIAACLRAELEFYQEVLWREKPDRQER